MQTDTGGVSIIRSLYIDNKTRNPKVKGVNEFINNVVYIISPFSVLSKLTSAIGVQLGRWWRLHCWRL